MKKLAYIVLLLLNLSVSRAQTGDIEVRRSSWNGYCRYDFVYNGHQSIVVCPDSAATGRPWIWRPAFFGAFPSVDKALLKEGFHVAYYDMTHRYGSPQAVEEGRLFYNYVCNTYSLSSKVTLEGISRGGYYAMNWAIAYPNSVACIYLDNPVCDIFSWPDEKKRPELWSDFLKEWKLPVADKVSFKGNPLDNLKALAEQHVPILAVCGDSDRVVPFRENMALLRDRYQQLGAPVELIIKPGADHHPHSLDNPEPIVDFILRNQPEWKQKQYVYPRGSLQNSYIRFERERKGKVAFLGGSITEMRGWRDGCKQYLKQRFPYTEFDFIEAGIPSTGTTPHAFRLEQDILSFGDIDLIFVEGAVNDYVNGFSARDQIRGMEGVVRHVFTQCPYADIVMLHFVCEPFLGMYSQGKTPDVILNHERISHYYNVPSVHLAREISERIADGEFDWEKFGGIHPSWFGHKFYTASLIRLLDEMWSQASSATIPEAHAIPDIPLDTTSYYKASFAGLGEVLPEKGWEYVAAWTPNNATNTRKGFVNVPVLYADTVDATFSFLFKGRAVGLFCICGPFAGMLEYSIDGSSYKIVDTYTAWSAHLYLPWAYVLEADLDPDREHKLVVRISERKNEKSIGHECIIRNILINR